jgi:hypothetical protein
MTTSLSTIAPSPILSQASSILSYPIRFVLPNRTTEGSKEVYEAGKLAKKEGSFPHVLNLSKANSDIRRGGHGRWVLVSGNEQMKIAAEASKKDEELRRLLNSEWLPLVGKKTSLFDWGHARELRGVNAEITEVSDRVSELNSLLFNEIPEGKVWEVFCASCRAIPSKTFDSKVEYDAHKQECRKLIQSSDEVGQKEREVFDLLRRLKAGTPDLKRFEELITSAKESAVRAVNVLKDPGAGGKK